MSWVIAHAISAVKSETPHQPAGRTLEQRAASSPTSRVQLAQEAVRHT
jgi:hypothetical protein